ncbi:MAG: carboxypeptidase regulatory-like domain-containing protein [Bacteroidales bacterium]|nr:carboxypeptidase regulatory-like domain-containing protein [Bacteroidales bacterium]
MQVTVKNSDGLTVSGANVKIDIDSSYVSREGVTNASGRFDTEFPAPAIFNINATYESAEFYTEIYTPDTWFCYQKGSNTVRLKEGEIVEATVTLDPGICRDRR